MTTIEKLFVQIFDRKNGIIEQVKQQTDLYTQHLASKLLIDGITPPPWLWNPNFHSESSDPKELKKEELISELLLPHPRPAVPNLGSHFSLYNKPVIGGDNGKLSEELFMQTYASKRGCNTGDRPTALPEVEGRDNDIGCALTSVPELDRSATSPQEQNEVRISNIYTNTGSNAEDRPTTALECHGNDILCTLNSVPELGRSAASHQVLDGSATSHQELDHRATSPRGQTEVRISNIYTAPDQSLARIHRSKSRQKALELRKSAKAAAKSGLTDEIDTGVPSRGIKMSRIPSQKLDRHNELFGSAKYSDAITDNCEARQAARECLSKEKNVNSYNGRITRSRSSCNQSSHESRSLKLDDSSDIGKEDGCRMTGSQRTWFEEISRPVSSSYTASQRITRSKSGASKKPPLGNSLNMSEGFHLQNVSDGEGIPHCAESNAIINKDGKSDYVTETELISDVQVEAQAACSDSNLDAAGLSVGFEAFVSMPPSDCSMFVKPKTLDFDDMESCSLNKTFSPMLENERRKQSSAKSFCTPVKSASSLDKITFDKPSTKSFEKQSLEQEESNKKADAWKDSFGTFAEEFVVSNKEVSESKLNTNLKNVEQNIEAVQEIQQSSASRGPDIALSSVEKGLDLEMQQKVKSHLEGSESSPKLQVEECEFGYDGGDRSETTSFSFKHQQLAPSLVSSLTKHSTMDQGCLVGDVVETDPRSSVDLSQCCVEDSPDLMCLENKLDKGKMSGLACSERTLLEKKSHVGEDGFLAYRSVGSLHHEDNSFSSSKIIELPHLEKSLLPGRRFRSAAESSWPQVKRRQIKGHPANFFSASPSCRVKDIHCIGVGDNLGTDLHYQCFPVSREGHVAQSNDDKSPKYHLTQRIEPSPMLQLEQDELEERNLSTNTPSTFKHGQLGPYVLSSFTKEAAGGFQDCSVAEPADTPSIDLDVRMQGDAQNCKNKLHSGNIIVLENKYSLADTKRILQETEPHFEEDVLFSGSSVASPEEKHLDSMAADQTMPEFEGFVIGSEENGPPHIGEDIFSLDKFVLPSNTIERASVLEQLCRSATMPTPLSGYSTRFKLHRTPDLYQSVPNGLLEHMDPRGALNLNDGGKQLRASYSCVDEVKCAFQGVSYSGSVPNSDSHFDWSLKGAPLSPVGKLWDRISSNSSSSEKQRSLNPELTCFPIEEDPSISEENESRDEVADTVQEEICSSLMNCDDKREPLGEITEAHVNLPSVSAVERFPDRSSLESVKTEVSFTGTQSKAKQRLGSRTSKRRCTNAAKENRTLSISTKSLNNRFSKPKMSGKTSLRKGGLDTSEKEPKRKNIVSNITSFVPLVQQKQAAAVVTGKRDVKVKALEAAEAAKRLEEKREKERKMKKEALKFERARIEQENTRQMELKMKKKEEEQKKKDADMAARKRLREEEERKEKERKRQRIGEVRRQQREQEEKLRVGKGQKEVRPSATDKNVNRGAEYDELRTHQQMENKQGGENIAKKPETEPVEGCEAFGYCGVTGEPTSVLTKTTEVAKTSREKSYEISPYQCSDDEDDEEEEIPTRKYVPSWASKNSVALVLFAQQKVDPDKIFPPGSFCSLDEVLRPRKLQQLK